MNVTHKNTLNEQENFNWYQYMDKSELKILIVIKLNLV